MSKSLFQIWLAEAQADYDSYKPELDKVEEQLGENPRDLELQEKHRVLKFYLDSLAEGIEMLKGHLAKSR